MPLSKRLAAHIKLLELQLEAVNEGGRIAKRPLRVMIDDLREMLPEIEALETNGSPRK